MSSGVHLSRIALLSLNPSVELCEIMLLVKRDLTATYRTSGTFFIMLVNANIFRNRKSVRLLRDMCRGPIIR